MEISLEQRTVRNNLRDYLIEFESTRSYIENDLTRRKFSSELDLRLGFQIKKIEETLRTKALQIKPDSFFDEWGPLLHDGAQTWIGLDFQILQSSYHDLYQIFDFIKPRANEKFIDLGAGYGRIGVFLQYFYPQTQFLGLELVKERVNEGNRIYSLFNMQNKKLIPQDLSKMNELPDGDFYFIYDFGSDEHLKKILELFKKVSGKTLIVKGQICRRIIEKDSYFTEGQKLKKCQDIYLYTI